MRVWILTVGEPLPIDGQNIRLLRSYLLAENLAKRGHEVVFWTSSFNHTTKKHRVETDAVLTPTANLKINVIKGPGYKKNISFQRIKDHRLLARRFSEWALTEERPDIILSSLPIIELCDEAAKLGTQWNIPIVLDARDMWPDIFVNVFPLVLRTFLKKTVFAKIFNQCQQACKQATAIIGITSKFVDWALTYTQREKNEYDRDFPLGYSEKNVNDIDLQAALKFWSDYGIEKTPNSFNIALFAYIGRMIDMPTIVSAAVKLKEQGHPHKFIICGQGDMLNKYQEMAKDCPNITFVGWIDGAKIKALMQFSHVGLLPYYNKPDFLIGIGNKPIEYMSGKLPVLSSLAGMVGELLDQQNCGMLYNENDPDSLVNAVVSLYDHPDKLNTMSANAYQVYLERFEANKVYNEMADYLEQLAARKHN